MLRETAVEVRDCEVEAVEVRLCEVDEVEVLRDGAAELVVVLRDGVVVVAERFAVLPEVEVRLCDVDEVEVRDCEDDEVRDWASSIGAEAVIAIATRDAVISVVIFFMV